MFVEEYDVDKFRQNVIDEDEVFVFVPVVIFTVEHFSVKNE